MKRSSVVEFREKMGKIGFMVDQAVRANGGGDREVELFLNTLFIEIGLDVMTKPPFVCPAGLPTTYNCCFGLTELICLAVGKNSFSRYSSGITQGQFPLRGAGVIQTRLRVEPLNYRETGEEAVRRLTSVSRILADAGDLAGFQHDHPNEVAKWSQVIALAETARSASSSGSLVPSARVVHKVGDVDHFRFFRLVNFKDIFIFGDGVLVRCE